MLIDFNKLWPKYNVKPKGVLHIGASKGQETEHYINLGVKDIMYIEALPDVFKDLQAHVRKFNGNFVLVNACVSDIDGKDVTFNKTNNEGQSSSILEFGTHAKEHPTVKVIEKIKMTTARVDTLFEKYGIDSGKYDFLNADIQGVELLALKGMGSMLHGFKWLYLEVNKDYVYANCPLVEEIDLYVSNFGFKRAETKWNNGNNWGDALYIKL